MKSIAETVGHKGSALRVLVVEHHPGMRAFLSGVARAIGLDVSEFGSGESALDALSREDFDLVITDLVLPGMDGYALIEWLASRAPDRNRPRIIVCSSVIKLDEPVQRAELEEADVLLTVPTTAVDLIEAIRKALEEMPARA